MLHRGQVLGVVPKSYLPNYREFYEKRQFSAARQADRRHRRAVRRRPCRSGPTSSSTRRRPRRASWCHVEICEDLWVPIPPSTLAALAGATVLANLVGQQHHHRQGGLPPASSAPRSPPASIAAYVYAGAGQGESTTDLAWDGHALIAENGNILAESRALRAARRSSSSADVDLDRLVADRMRHDELRRLRADHRRLCARPTRSTSRSTSPDAPVPLRRDGAAVPLRARGPASSATSVAPRCTDPGAAVSRRACGRPGSSSVVHRRLGRPRLDTGAPRRGAVHGPPRAAAHDVLGVHAARLRHVRRARSRNAHRLMAALGVTRRRDRHPPRRDPDAARPRPPGRHRRAASTTAPTRTCRPAPARRCCSGSPTMHDGIVLGTGDLSELALGLVHLRRRRPHVALRDQRLGTEDPHPVPDPLGRRHRPRRRTPAKRCESIVDTTISPELVPPAAPTTATSRASAAKTSSAPTSCRTSTSTTCSASATARRRSRSSRSTPGATATQGHWPDAARPTKRNEYDLPHDLPLAPGVPRRFFGRTSSNARRCPTDRRSVPVDRCRRAATGGAERRLGRGVARRDRRVRSAARSDLPDPSDQAACSRSSSSQAVAQRKVASTTSAGWPSKCSSRVCVRPAIRRSVSQTVPGGWSSCGAGPATPKIRDTGVGLEQLRHVLRHGCDRPLGHHRTVGHVEQGALHIGRVGDHRAVVPVRGTLGGRERPDKLTTGERLRHGQPRPVVTQKSADRRDVRVLRLCHGAHHAHVCADHNVLRPSVARWYEPQPLGRVTQPGGQ